MATDRGYPWLKMYPILLDDPRWLRLSDGAKALYFQLYLLAGKSDAGGLVVVGSDLATPEEIGFILRREVGIIEGQISELVGSTLLTQASEGLAVARFQDEQGPSHAEKREEWKDRQKRKREKFKNSNEELNKDQDEDEEEEVSRESRVTNADVTLESRVTNPPAPAFQEFKPSDPADRVWRKIKPASLTIPPTLRETVIPVIDAALSRHAHDEDATAAEGKTYFDAWCTRRGKDGKFYSPSGKGWIDWWAQGEIPTSVNASVPQFAEEYR